MIWLLPFYDSPGYMIKYLLFLTFAILASCGCSSVPDKKLSAINNKTAELSQMFHLLEKRVEGQSKSISLIVNDGNRLHNKLEDVENSHDNVLVKLQNLETSFKELAKNISEMEANSKKIETEINKKLENLHQADVELSNRLEMLKLEIKEKSKRESLSN